MQVTIHRPGGQQGRLKARIERVAEEAGRLVAAHLGGRLPAAFIVLTDGGGMTTLIQRADLEIIGGAPAVRRIRIRTSDLIHTRGVFGATVVARQGPTALINGPRHGGNLRELDRTVIHELAHVVQLGNPDACRRRTAYLRQLYGLDPKDRAAQRAYDRMLAIHEQQAHNLEALARRLPASTEPE